MSTPPFAEPFTEPIGPEDPNPGYFSFTEPEPPQEPEESSTALMAPPAQLTDEQLLTTANTVTVRSTVLAKGVANEATCQTAVNYANTIHEWIKAAKAHFDPLVERARKPYQDRLDERSAVLKPLEDAKERLTGKAGAVTTWLAEQKRLAKEKADAEQLENDRIAAVARQKAEAERLAAEKQRREAAEAVEREKAEQARLLREAQEAHARGEREKVEEAKRLANEAAARANAARQQVATASAAAVAAEEKRDTVVSELVKAENPAANIEGAQSKKRWTWEFTLPDTLAKLELAKAIAYPFNARGIIGQIKEIDGWEKAEGHEIVALIEHLALTAETHAVPIAVFDVATKYVNNRVRDDGDTLRLPGIRIFDGGSVAVGGRKGRAS